MKAWMGSHLRNLAENFVEEEDIDYSTAVNNGIIHPPYTVVV